ncbi:uncharacterized protein K452DRAFT_277819 [Aplosporella prunicola CBS 121167]|uniref:Carboxylic ester hydrolase n=1 Tax=Aplosporella prunicola CBS 121167 TaxID=1176127 RepID=A0A6A6B200_9PEZI|nr:uncharacterized protein K452DRAFT_277819 [Aplosporella prunicola CBS 121167]KAF2138080.1 hypothetical protein K452DRAFT_277819 [Aplosporella prunicola CBS 121167]
MQSIRYTFSYLSTLLLSIHVYASGGAPLADLGYVRYTGFTNETAGINYFRGIPYAQPPIGQLRWQKPLPIEELNSFAGQTINASAPAKLCYQAQPYSLWVDQPGNHSEGNTTYWNENYPQSEGCLVLSVLAPRYPVNNSLPVFVAIHGGGYTQGSGHMNSPGDAIVHKSNGSIIYVEIQYRLGIFGFLAGSSVMEDGVANAGLLDQRAALNWVQRHISAFGGDPNRVTIWGGSAGGGSVSFQLMAGGAFDKPPFSAAIVEYPWWQPLPSISTQETQFHTVLDIANCTSLSCLRSQPSSVLQFANQHAMNVSYPSPGTGFGTFYYGPVVDGSFIPYLPSEALRRGRFYTVPLLVDRDADEGYYFSNLSMNSISAELTDAAYLFPSAGRTFFSRLLTLYPRVNYDTIFAQRAAWFGDTVVNCPTARLAAAFVDRGAAVFKMVFAADGGRHSATGVFLTEDSIGFPKAKNGTLADIMSDYWISFAKEHDPNVLKNAAAPIWPSYASDGEALDGVKFDVLRVEDERIAVQQDPDAASNCDFLAAQSHVIRN